MKLRHKYLAIMAIPVVVLAVATMLAHSEDEHALAGAAAVDHAYEVHLKANEVFVDLVDSETATRGYMLTGDRTFLGPYQRGARALGDDLGALFALVRSDDSQRANLDALAPLVTERMDLLRRQQAISPITTAKDRAIAWPMMRRGNLLMSEIRAVFDRIEALEDLSLRREQAGLSHTKEFAETLQFGVLPLAVALSLLLVIMVSGRVVRRVVRIQENALRLETGGPVLAIDAGKDEIGQLSRSLAELEGRLAETQAELEHQATTDSLTGIANRRGFFTIAEYQVELARRSRHPVELAFIDVDGLKRVNDTLGHDQGDLMIQEVAALIRDTVRAADVIARVGGDEFCVLIATEHDSPVGEAFERLKRTVRWANSLPGREYPISISVGFARFDGNGRDTIADLMRRADQAMYEHKRTKAPDPARSA